MIKKMFESSITEKLRELMDALCDPANAGKISEIEKQLSELEDSLIAWEEEHYPMYYEEK